MSPEVAEELDELYRHVGDELTTPEVLRAIAVGTRRAGALAVSVAELDEIAAEMSGPPWPG